MLLEVGEIFEGKVTGVTKFGAFVEFADGKTGMVHISEIASTFVKEIKDFVAEGQAVKVKVISISDEGKIALSMKKAEPVPVRNIREPRQERPRTPRYSRPEPKPMATRPGDYEWQAKAKSGNFEDMMSQFKQTSEEKISDLKRSTETKRGGGFSRKDHK